MITTSTVCEPSCKVVSREIEGEIIIVPLMAGVGDLDDELYTLNETGRAIWRLLDGRRTLGEVASALSPSFDETEEGLATDITGFAEELVRRGILTIVS